MTTLTVDAGLRTKLYNLSESVKLCDEEGRVLGRFVPVLDPSQYEAVEQPISADELQRRMQEPDYSTAEVLAYLEKL